jgi:hypothetical protein
MRTDQLVLAIKLAGVLALPFFFTGCDTFPDQQSSRGANLSDAMRASATGSHENVGGHSTGESYSSSGTTADIALGAGSGAGMDATVSYNNTEYFWQVLADASYALPINSKFKSLEHFTLTPFAVEDERNMLGIYVGGAAVQLQPGSLADQATDDVWMLETGLTYRRYLNNSRTALSPYVTTSVGFVMLGWSYRSPVTSGSDTFDSDSLLGAEGSVAIGVATRRDYCLGAFLEAGIGGTVFSDTTANGFHNDVFNNFGYVSVKAGVSLKF